MVPVILLVSLLFGSAAADCSTGDTAYMCCNIDKCWSDLAFGSRDELAAMCDMQSLPIGSACGGGGGGGGFAVGAGGGGGGFAVAAGGGGPDCSSGDTAYMCWNIDQCWTELAFASRDQLEFLCNMQDLPTGPGAGGGGGGSVAYGGSAVITNPPRNITVPPGAEAQFACSADDTIKMLIMAKEDYASQPEVADLIAQGITATTQKTIQVIDEAYKQHEGWYVCVAYGTNGDSVQAEAYLRILDLCAVVSCGDGKECKADPYTGTYECICPGDCDQTFDPVCASDCSSYFNECTMRKESCEKGLAGVFVASRGLCTSTPSDPVFYSTPTAGRFSEGSRQTFSASASGSGVIYTWYAGGRVVGNGASISTEVSTANAGEWTVTASVCAGTKSVSSSFSVSVESRGLSEPDMQCCKVHGDPHVVTFDQVKYDYMGSCTYILSAAQTGEWMVYGTFKPCGDKTKQLSCIVSITVIYGNELVQFLRMYRVNYQGREFMVGKGQSQTIGQMRIENIDMKYTISLGSTGIKVIWDGITTSQICLPKKCQAGVMGMCSNADCDPNNEFNYRGRNLGPARTSSAFANSWAVQESGCDNEPESGVLSAARTRPCDFISAGKRAKYQARCQAVLGLGAFQNCIAQTDIDLEALMANCNFDSCAGLSVGGGCPGDGDLECAAASDAQVYALIAKGMTRAEAMASKPVALDPACMAGMNLANDCRAWGAFISTSWREEVSCPGDDELAVMRVCP